MHPEGKTFRLSGNNHCIARGWVRTHNVSRYYRLEFLQELRFVFFITQIKILPKTRSSTLIPSEHWLDIGLHRGQENIVAGLCGHLFPIPPRYVRPSGTPADKVAVGQNVIVL